MLFLCLLYFFSILDLFDIHASLSHVSPVILSVTVDCITPTAYACEEDGVAVVEFMYMFSETGSTINLGEYK